MSNYYKSIQNSFFKAVILQLLSNNKLLQHIKKMLSKHYLNPFIFVIYLLSPICFRTLNHPLCFLEWRGLFLGFRNYFQKIRAYMGTFADTFN